MAQFNVETQELNFDDEDLQAAWNNAPVLENKDPQEFRLCYICKFHLIKKEMGGVNSNDGFGWTIDLINAKKPTLEFANYVAVHENCLPNRPQIDARRTLQMVKATKWKFNDDFWNN